MLNENFSLGRLHKKCGEIPGDCPEKISPRPSLGQNDSRMISKPISNWHLKVG